MKRALPLVLAALVACAGSDDAGDSNGSGSGPDNALEGDFPETCGEVSSTSGLNSFSYEVDDLDGCNDIQVFGFDFDWPNGPTIGTEYALTEGKVEVRVTSNDGQDEEEYEGEGRGYIYAPGADPEGMEAGTIEIRVLLAEAAGAVTITAAEAGW